MSVSDWRQSNKQLHTSNVEQRHVPVQVHIVRLMHTVEQTLASVYLTGLTEIEESSTEGRNTQKIDIKDSVSQAKDIRKGTPIPSKKDTFQQARKTFRDIPRHETLKPTSRLASPFNQTIDINNLNRRTHSYDGMYYVYAEIVYLDEQEQSGVPTATISE